MKNTILLFGILGMFSFPSAAQVTSLPVLAKTVKPKSGIPQIPASFMSSGSSPIWGPGGNPSTPLGAGNQPIGSAQGKQSATKTSTWCISDQVTGNFIQQQISQNPDYLLQMNALSQQLQKWIANNPNYLAQKAVKTIPVAVHVLYNNAAENVSTALINDMIATLNEDFRRLNSDTTLTNPIFEPVAADAQIEFCLAIRDPGNNATDGIVRKSTTKTYWDPDTETDDMKKVSTGGDAAWDPYNYLNIWICDIDNGAGYGTAGYAYLPTAGMHGSWMDGLVIDNDIGICYGCRTATHEIGHYFGLKHTWGNDPPSCSNDDGFTDTPTCSDENYGCNTSQNTCSNDVPNTVDQIENYMSYADCQNMFTTMQANYMNSVLNSTRSSLLSSDGCQPTVLPVTDFTANQTSVTTGQFVVFTDLTAGGPTSWSWNFGGGGTPNTSTGQNPQIQFNTVGIFTVTLTATNSLGSDAETKTSYITVTANTTNCDTVHWDYLSVEDSITFYYIESAYPLDSGWLTGTNAYGIAKHAQLFALSEFSPNNYVSGGIFYFAIAYKAPGSSAKVVFTIWDDNGAGGAPGTVLGSDTADLADIVSDVQGGFLTERLFDSPVQVSGNYFYGFQLINYNTWGGATSDSLALVQTEDGAKTPGSQIPWCLYNSNWISYSSLLGFTATNLYINPYMTDLPPTANFTANALSGCAPFSVTFDASASVNANEFLWDTDGNDTLDDYSTSPTLTVTYNTPGTYSVELWVVGPCTGLGMNKKTNYITVYSAPSATITSTATGCSSCTGTATVSASGGTSPYTYSWNTNPVKTTSTASALCAGSYQVLVTTLNGCTTNSGVSVNTTANMALSVSSNDANCGLNNGSATVSASGGTAPFSYNWSNGGTFSTISGLAAGTYHVTMTDVNGCTVKTDFFSAAVVSTVPDVIVTIDTNNASCGACPDGSANATVTGGISPYTFLWSNSSTGSNATGLVPNNYGVTITDANGCSKTTSFVISFTTGFIQVQSSVNIEIFPNPTDGNISIRFNNTNQTINRVKITDMIGRTVFEKEIVSGTTILPLNFVNEDDGLYFLQLFTDSGVIARKITLVK